MSWRNLIWMVIAVCLAALALFFARRRPLQVLPDDPAARDLAGAIGAYKLISRESYTGFGAAPACRGAIDGMVRQVDGFSAYIPPGNVRPFESRLCGEMFETGLRIAAEDDRLMVVGPLPGSPAHKAGLFAGLEVLSINRNEARYLTLAEARRLLQRPEDRPVTLRLRSGGGRAFTRELTPARFEVETVTGIVRDETGRWRYELDEDAGIFYVRIGEFLGRTPDELQEVYRRLKRPKALVLDLRDNPGGTLETAALVADRFLDEGLIVRALGRRGQQHAYYAHADGTYPPAPMVVLINSRTASAAEIVAGALRAHRRAVLVGRDSYGKWSVQKTFNLGSGLGKIHLTTGEYFLFEPPPATAPAGTRPADQPAATSTRPHQARPGLQPDVPVRLTAAEARRLALLRLEATVLAQPLTPATLPTQRYRSARLKRRILKTDAQLARAVQLLREDRNGFRFRN